MYRLAPLETAELEKQLKDLQDHGYIQEVTSSFGSGILFVPKANGKLRMVVDYRPINRITLVDNYPLPRIDEMLIHLLQIRSALMVSSNPGSSRPCGANLLQDKVWHLRILSHAVRVVQRTCHLPEDNELRLSRHEEFRRSLH